MNNKSNKTKTKTKEQKAKRAEKAENRKANILRDGMEITGHAKYGQLNELIFKLREDFVKLQEDAKVMALLINILYIIPIMVSYALLYLIMFLRMFTLGFYTLLKDILLFIPKRIIKLFRK